MQFVREFRVIEWGMRLQEGALWFHKDHRFVRDLVSEFFGMRSIVTADTKNLHKQVVFLINTSDTLLRGLFIPYIQASLCLLDFRKAGWAAKVSNQSD